MKIKKHTLLEINHCRKGKFNAIAFKDFDTETETFYPVVLASKVVEGLNTEWIEGEDIPCRGSFCTVKVVDK